ncbi:MAG: polysaccharide deacetylase family protein [Bacteroidia bacterium]|nr:polysaccharide deacetylase family protein [Bacteroidia bacterium]
MYFPKTPEWIIRMFPGLTWRIPGESPVIYLTFDDGPHPEITDWVLDLLEKYNAEATFFLIGKNVRTYPETAEKILKRNHRIGNHTFSHKNGWNTPLKEYLGEVRNGQQAIADVLGIQALWFRPPYGKLRFSQLRSLKNTHKIAMMDILCGDFDTTRNAAFCTENVIRNYQNGSIVVFHDSEKAFPRLKETLPQVLAFCKENGILCKALPESIG